MIRRTPLKTRTPLARGTPLRRRSRLRARNDQRRAERFARQYGSPERLEWIHAQPCYTCSSPGPCEASHYPSRGAGGGKDDQLPQCPQCHRELHQMGAMTFERCRGVDLRALTARCARRWKDLY